MTHLKQFCVLCCDLCRGGSVRCIRPVNTHTHTHTRNCTRHPRLVSHIRAQHKCRKTVSGVCVGMSACVCRQTVSGMQGSHQRGCVCALASVSCHMDDRGPRGRGGPECGPGRASDTVPPLDLRTRRRPQAQCTPLLAPKLFVPHKAKSPGGCRHVCPGRPKASISLFWCSVYGHW